MNPVAAIFDSLVLYRYSLVLALAGAAGVCFFMACCSYAGISSLRSSAAVLTALVLGLLLARLVYWYGRPDQFSSLLHALTDPSTTRFALAGFMAGCILSAILTGGPPGKAGLLDCMCVAGCFSISLGRLGCFFTEADRGQVMVHLTGLPWAWPVVTASGQLEYRFATFLFQSAAAALIGSLLTVVFFRKKRRPGDVTLLFLLLYSATQVLLDSTRYDSLYLRSNGFISIVQILSAGALGTVTILLCIRTVKSRGMKKWMIPLWISLTALFAFAGYMEYYVQRHGREAAFGYSVMGLCLAGIAGLGIFLWHLSGISETK